MLLLLTRSRHEYALTAQDELCRRLSTQDEVPTAKFLPLVLAAAVIDVAGCIKACPSMHASTASTYGMC
jgi:hypothetical protein